MAYEATFEAIAAKQADIENLIAGSKTNAGASGLKIMNAEGNFLINTNNNRLNIRNSSEASIMQFDASSKSVTIGELTIETKAILNLESTTQGLLLPRLTTTQRDAISTPPAGLMIYNTTTNKLNVFTTAWEAVTSA